MLPTTPSSGPLDVAITGHTRPPAARCRAHALPVPSPPDLDTYVYTMDRRELTIYRHIMLGPLPSARIDAAAAAISLPPTATNHVTL